MKADLHPSPRALFLLSKTEQDALQLFVDELLQKHWIEVSDSPWVSNILAVLKNDQVTGKAPSRSEWIRSGNASLPVRWVLDYLYVNSQMEVPKIPLLRIEELFDRMVGCCLFLLST
ncbi:Retroelement pol Polyprotein [Phytophthora megakarya]|uniref:Retroelement pol Polyprotein n=1 Tax=Phytophthora megakarya TaxID=4795 RepID=A0A225VST1_9STRA|nr:Retroelement pol Polyprotein [Phytophthora megakarya]